MFSLALAGEYVDWYKTRELNVECWVFVVVISKLKLGESGNGAGEAWAFDMPYLLYCSYLLVIRV